MFTYRCPGCGKHHAVDKIFEQAYETPCLRCGVHIAVTSELIHPSQNASRTARSAPPGEESITKAPSSAVQVADEGSRDQEAVDAFTTEEPDEVADAEPSKNGRKKKSAPRRASKRAEKPEPEIDEEEEEEEETKPAPRPTWPPPKTPSTKPKSPRPRWQLIAALSTVALVICGAGGYLIFGGKKPAPKPVAKAPAKPTPKPTVKPKPIVKEPDPPPKAPPARDVAISASRLSAELAAQPGATDSKYAGKILEVSGLFDKIDRKDGLRPPSRPHAVFATQGTVISCDLQGSPTDLAGWSRMVPNQPFTVRGKYEKKGYLRDCALMPFTASADNRYKSKTMEVTGRVDGIAPATPLQPYPSIVLEKETNGILEVRCLFRNTDAEEVSKIQPGSLLTIRGECNGQQKVQADNYVRFDNCQLVYTSAPTEGKLRIDAPRLLREYEEDLRSDYLPAPGEEERIDTLWNIRQLAQEVPADGKAFDKKYRNRILRVTGKRQQLAGNMLMLESGDTDLAFRVECRFGTTALEMLRQRRESVYRIRGLYTIASDGKTLRLDNCQLDVPRPKSLVLTADYLPHRSGRSFALDIASFGVLVNRRFSDVVRREVHVQGKDGLTEILVTQVGKLPGKSLFADKVQEEWSGMSKTRIKHPETSGIYSQRLKSGFVEFGTPHLGANGKTQISWMPIVKLEVQAGEKWTWDSDIGAREYVLEKFDDFHGRPCAVVREIVTSAADVLHPIEILHVYAKGLGEVERREWRQLDKRGGKTLLSETKWVEDPQSASEPLLKRR